MDYAAHVDAIERESTAIVAALRAGPLDIVAPTCPDWTLADLGTHIGHICGFWNHVISEGTGRAKEVLAEPSPGETRSDWFADWCDELSGLLVTQLRSVDPGTDVWTWDPNNQTVSYAARRVAHELAVHRFDVQAARSATEPIDGDLAVDGIEEFFELITAWRAAGRDVGTGLSETMHLHATEPAAEWTITLWPDGLTVERRHIGSDLALQGTASDLELLLLQRPPIGRVKSFGDYAVLEAWNRSFSFG